MGVARTDLNPNGSVQVGGELWTAELEEGSPMLYAGDRIKVIRVEGLRLIVRQAE
jgi:membrane-bound serine protease (ClpP class)